jgi:hypothetical protein
MQLHPAVNGVLVYSTLTPPVQRREYVEPPRLTKAQQELAHQMRCRTKGCLRCQ